MTEEQKHFMYVEEIKEEKRAVLRRVMKEKFVKPKDIKLELIQKLMKQKIEELMEENRAKLKRVMREKFLKPNKVEAQYMKI